jgi:hypothetical protein
VTTNGPLLTSGEAQEAPLTTAEALEILDVPNCQLYRWRKEGLLTSELERTAGRGRNWWPRAQVLALAERLPPKAPGHTRQARKYLRSPS